MKKKMSTMKEIFKVSIIYKKRNDYKVEVNKEFTKVLSIYFGYLCMVNHLMTK